MLACAMILATGDDASTTYVLDVLAILGTAAVVAIFMQRMRLAVIPAYLIAGALVGPYALRLVRSPESLDAISSLAIILLMFGVGLHLHLAALGRSLFRMIAIGAVSCIVTIIALWPIALAFGARVPAALVVGMALSMSSTAVVLRLIAERGELKHVTGRLALAILVVQDMLVIPMLAVLPMLAEWAGTGSTATTESDAKGQWIRFISEAAISVGSIAAIIVVGRLILPRLLHEAAREKSGEVMMIASVAIALGAGVVTQALGFSAELGAFLAGFLLAATPFRHQISGQIAPLRDLFMAVFFTTLGMQLDARTLAEYWWVILLGGAIVTAIKAAVIGGTAWAIGATPAISVAVGFALAQGGEFGLVLLAAAEDRGIASELIVMNASAIIIISLILTPALVNIGRRWSVRWQDIRCAPWIAGGIQHDASSTPQHAAHAGRHVIIGGYGQVGKRLADALEQAGMHCTIIELNRELARDERLNRGQQREFVFGDVSNREVLDSAGILEADALALTMPDEQPVLRACAIAKRLKPGILVFARVTFASQERVAHELGADLVIVEELEAAKAMREAVLARLNPPAT